MTTRIYYRGTRADVHKQANRLRDILTGREPDQGGVASGFMLSLGFGALADIHDAFIVKSRGGTDEMGIKWPPLSKAYLAYQRRFGKGEKTALMKAAGLNPRVHKFAPGNKVPGGFWDGGNRNLPSRMGLLSKHQVERWWQVYFQARDRFMLSTHGRAAKARAAAVAWAQIKQEGGKAMLEVYGNRQVDILKDTGILLNSLGPGMLSGDSYSKPTANGGDQQVFSIGAGQVIVGTNVPYAAVHNYGHASKPKMPRRQFLPDNEGQVPDVWWQRWLDIGSRALEIGAARLFAA